MRSLVVGMGQVGQALAKVIGDTQTLDKEEKDIELPIDILHITIPYNENFVDQVKAYQDKYIPLVTIIYSTVPIGTSKQLGAVHSPIEGKHPNLEDGIRRFTRFIGGASNIAAKFWRRLGVEVKDIDSSDATEFMKLRSTAKYGINIVWTDYEARVSKKLGIDFQVIKDFDKAYNELYAPDYQRYILDPPEGKIGGHCIVPNAEILDKQFPNDMLKMIKGMK